MKIQAYLLSILIIFLLISCEHPNDYERNNPFDPEGTTQGGLINTIHEFLGENSHALCLALGPDGTFFLIHSSPYNSAPEGLSAYTFHDSSFIQKAFYSINQDHKVGDIAIGPDGIICTANSGLRVYVYDGSSFVLRASRDLNAEGLAIDMNGTIFTAFGENGLYAYTLGGSDLVGEAHINDPGYAYKVTLGPDSIIYLANGNDGLRAYTYANSSFTNVTRVSDGREAIDVVIGSDGTIFLADKYDGLRAYTFNGSSFQLQAQLNLSNIQSVTVDSNGLIYLPRNKDGLQVVSYDGSSFKLLSHINNGGEAFKVVVNSSGTVFLANGSDGLRVYVFKK